MVETGPAKKLVVYVAESARHEGRPVYEELLHWMRAHGVAGATATRAAAGFGASGQIGGTRRLGFSGEVPMRVEAVDSAEKIHRILPFIFDIVGEGLVEVQETEVVKAPGPRGGEARSPAERVRLTGRAKMLRVYVDEDDRWEGEPLYEAILKTLRMMDVAGATVYRGVMGYGAGHRLHKSGFLGLSHNLPIMVTVVDSEEQVRRAVAALDEMVGEGLVVLSDVEVIKYTHSRA